MSFKLGDKVELSEVGKRLFHGFNNGTVTEICDQHDVFDCVVTFAHGGGLIVYNDEIERFEVIKPKKYIMKHEF